MKIRVLLVTFASLGLVIGFQNCGGAVGSSDPMSSTSLDASEKSSLSGSFEVQKFVSTSSCPDQNSEGLACASVFEESEAESSQIVEFLADGTVMVQGACNTFYGHYELNNSGSMGQIAVKDLYGTSVDCDGVDGDEEARLVHRLGKSVRVVSEGADNLMVFTDQSSAIALKRSFDYP